MYKKIHHIGIYSNDPESLSTWYRDHLNFEVVSKLEKTPTRPKPIYFLKLESGSTIEILPFEAMPAGERGRGKYQPGNKHLGILVDDFDKASLELKSKGISVFDAKVTSKGWKIGYLKDPDGNLIEISDSWT